MRVFVVAAMGAALLTGCAPFEHGHYSNDVSYRNTVGDPPGTPLVYRGGETPRNLAGSNSNFNGSKKPWRHGHGSGSYATANNYAAPVASPSFITRPNAYPVTQASYAAPVQQAYAAPVQQYVAPSYTQPVAQSYVAQQSYIRPALQSTYAAAAPVYQQNNVLATSYGGSQRIDADGYAICDIPFSDHAAQQVSRFHAPHRTSQFRARF